MSPSRRGFLTATRPGPHAARVTDQCLTHTGVDCGICRDVCAVGALGFVAVPGAPPRAVIDPALCTACGDCVGVCPVSAILPGAKTG
jgi:ferredoxin-type protein NapF